MDSGELKIKVLVIVFAFCFVTLSNISASSSETISSRNCQIALGAWSEVKINRLISDIQPYSPSKRISMISEKFLNTSYEAHTLIGSYEDPEKLVVNLDGIDCFTFLDYVEALRLAGNYSSFIDNIINIRYKKSRISYDHRNHFFSDWKSNNADHVEDVTREVGLNKTEILSKNINLKKKGSFWLKGIKSQKRDLLVISVSNIDKEILSRLKNGDYIGLYSTQKGLDAYHLGIFIRNEKGSFLRHASLSDKKVLDSPFLDYLQKTNGIIVYRPKSNT
ncbi:MAG: DUF1460 domain-containing protein [Candidatus Margulisbacteria bacterium]|nr:DUF1460 domain-containing protein [Candidatus Margulisiibacteriota bacterium]